MNIRHIEAADAAEFLTLLKEVDNSGTMLFEPNERQSSIEQERQKINNLLKKDNSTILVAEDNHALVGYLISIGGTVNRNKHCAYLVIGIAANYRGKGIGEMLFKQLFIWAKATGLSRLELTVMAHNHPAQKLYQKLGFTIEGEKNHSLIIDGEPINEYYMFKLL